MIIPDISKRAGGGGWRLAEVLLIYVALPLLLLLARLSWGAFPVLPVLWLAALPAALWLRRDGLTWRDLIGWRVPRGQGGGILLRVTLVAVALLMLVRLWHPEWLFELPLRRPRIWLLVMLLYPLASVLPQGIVYRALWYRRYGNLFPSAPAARLAGALAFGLAHVVFGNIWAVGLTVAGGWFFGRTYERSGSLPASNLEHALCGCLVFTVGLGRLLYHGTLALVGG